jgi:hypothetical protein
MKWYLWVSIFPLSFPTSEACSGLNSPELYQLMHSLGGVPFGIEETPQEARNAFAAVRETIRAALEAHGVQRSDLNGDVDILWSLLHGLISLTMTGRIAGGEQRAAALVERAVHDLLLAWVVEARETSEAGDQPENR